eukprot:CAMPEP_0182444882 /NCGR_PEP_ID=MMETSP1172-20130603/3191_1 /TAXON_ID=708627 /ORGANISM="Timspurckia oligopyrenoides, Strain CCMP3278" /LENGTH=242 /DNA_ID=CAMNT_0024640537 /DNA_START=240 /DNA_END=968 /DNA_ORIENTATION=+
MEYLPESAQDYIRGSGFGSALVQSLMMTIVTELGDKTFFIAAILAMKHPRALVLAGALLALYVMTVLSVLMGKAFPLLFDKKYSSILASLLFAYFGVSLLRDWYKSRNEEHHESEELQEVEQELERKESGTAGGSTSEANRSSVSVKGIMSAIVSPILMRSFMLTFVAEWGDRSQIATIAFAAAQNAYGVILGCIFGHSICTGLAVVGGRLLASRISERMVALTGGLLFLLFAVLTFSGKLE